MPRQGILRSGRRAPTVTSLARDLLRAGVSAPQASTSKVGLDGSTQPGEGPVVTWLPSRNARSPGKAVYTKLPKPAPLGPPHYYRFEPALGLQEPVRRLDPEHGSRSRYQEHMHHTLASDLLYMTYDHDLSIHPPPNPAREPLDPMNPYNKGLARDKDITERLIPKARAVTPDEPLHLTALHLSFTYYPAYTNKTKLLPVLSAMRSLTGVQPVTPGEPSAAADRAIQITYTKASHRRHGLRLGVPYGCHVKLVGADMYAFIETLVESVLPRWRNFRGVPLPRVWTPIVSSNSTFGWRIPAEAVPLFPQLEVNSDRFPHFGDLGMSFVSSARGPGAMARTIALLSGLRIPFVPYFERPEESAFTRQAGAAETKSKSKQKKKK